MALGEPRSWACRAADGTLPQTTLPVSAFTFPEFMSVNVDIMSLERSERDVSKQLPKLFLKEDAL